MVEAGAESDADAIRVDFGLGALLALGSMVGAPLGARLLAGSSDSTLKIAFGVLQIVIGISLVWP